MSDVPSFHFQCNIFFCCFLSIRNYHSARNTMRNSFSFFFFAQPQTIAKKCQSVNRHSQTHKTTHTHTYSLVTTKKIYTVDDFGHFLKIDSFHSGCSHLLYLRQNCFAHTQSNTVNDGFGGCTVSDTSVWNSVMY